MKRTIFIFLICFFTYSSGTAQQELLDGEWILDYVVIDNDTYFAPPIFSPFPACLPIDYFPGISFSIDSAGEYQAIANLTFNYWFHDAAGGSMTIDTNSFTALGAITLGDCDCICELEVYYLSTILAGDFTFRTFNYVIENISGSDILTITSPEGNIAVFYDYVLAIDDLDSQQGFILHPNPSSKELYIVAENSTIQTLKIFSVTGVKVISYSGLNPNVIDISELANGLYFVEIVSTKGLVSVQRFLKH